MKTIQLSAAALIAAFTLATATTASAFDGAIMGKVTVVKSESKKFQLHIPKTMTQGSGAVQVSLIDTDGTTLFSGTVIDRTQKGVPFDVASLPDGKYFLTTSTNTWWSSQELNIRDNALSIDDTKLTQIARPTISTYAKNKLQVTIPTVNVESTNVAIYNQNDELVFVEEVAGNVSRLDLNGLPQGAYTLTVGSDVKRFAEQIKVEK